ncbi:Histone-lysine N-methyltransferase ATXR3 [Heracleum sosnowskyi]|uniref:Histone-lysine N-methyltransferase ATXR3 n=1 Tax=Heracleum sosnowskyi TaxID=360622 RepID=A0AAD8MZ47_9APIA|nr:Histone-lysine N-methyltransferase ATXR3 [Heracleum sosnowskyi]
MGDGGVACVPSQHVMEQFSVTDTSFCGGNGKHVNSKVKQRKIKMKREGSSSSNVKKSEVRKSEIGSLGKASKSSGDEVVVVVVENNGLGKDEVEEGEVENGEFIPDKPRKVEIRSRIEKVDSVVVDSNRKKRDVEFSSVRWQKGEVDNGKFGSGKYKNGEVEVNESGSWKAGKDELENGEFVPDRWHNSELMKDDSGYARMHRYDSSRDKEWRCDSERSPPSSKYTGDKEFNRRSGQFSKSSSRWEGKQERKPRISSKIVDDDGSLKNEYYISKSHGREYSSSVGNRLKRHGTDSDSSDRRHYSEYDDYAMSMPKSRRLTDDGNRSAYAEHYQRPSMERPYRNSVSSRNMSSDRYSSRQFDSSSKVIYDRHNGSPHQYERSPREQVRYHDHRDRSPAPTTAHRGRSPYDRSPASATAYRGRSPYDRSPAPTTAHRGRSPYDRSPASTTAHRGRSPYDRSPAPSTAHRGRSPYDRSRYPETRNASPSYSDRSPQDQNRYHDRRDRTPNFQEHSSLYWGRDKYRETNRKIGSQEKRQSQHGKKLPEEKLNIKKPDGRDSELLAKEPEYRRNLDFGDKSHDKMANLQSHKEEPPCSPCVNKNEPLQVNATTDELLSMEEDMDICDTPPHVAVVADSDSGKWFYLDHYGVDQGPSRLCDLKMLVEKGILVSDHLIKHLDSDRWVTVENAVSPLVTSNFPSIISDTVAQLVTPPEAPGNALADSGDVMQHGNHHINDEMVAASTELLVGNMAESEASPDFHLDERVGALLEGCTIVPGRELEAVGEVLQMTFDHIEWWKWGHCEEEHFDQRGGECSLKYVEGSLKGTEESPSAMPSVDTDSMDSNGDWFSGRWSCKGGDWKRSDEAYQDRLYRKKNVLNDGYPLCLMPRSGHEDPRRGQKDELYNSSSRRFDLPLWAFSSPDEYNESSSNKLSQSKSIAARAVRGTMLPVVRINTCVVKDHGSFVSEPRSKAKVKDRHSSRSSRHYSSITDAKRPSVEGDSSVKNMHDQDSQGSLKSKTSINIPKNRLCTADDLQLHMGDWYYLDGTGHEQGPLLSSEIQVLAEQGIIQKRTSIFRKVDNIWVPVISVAQASQAAGKIQRDSSVSSDNSGASRVETKSGALSETFHFTSFESLHPHYIGYTRGKLHELVMKSYKSREFAAAINEVLDPWINLQQPRKEMEKHTSNLSVTRFQRSEQFRLGKRRRFLVDESEENYESEDDIPAVQNDDCLFEDLCKDVTFPKEDKTGSKSEVGSWGLLDGLVLARVFHFLKTDLRSVIHAESTCKHWRCVSKFYKNLCLQADLSCVATSCTDSVIRSILNGYNKEKVTSLVLRGCTNITSGTLEEVLQLLPSISFVDIRGCNQFDDLTSRFPSISWIGGRLSHSRTRSLKPVSDRNSSVFKTSYGSQNEDSSGLRDYLESSSARDSANQLFRRSLYKRSKLFDAKRSSSILSRGAHLRHLAFKKSGNGYKKMEEFLTSSLKGIMKENTFDFFEAKVAQITRRMENGYYAAHGLHSVKEDIRRMCRDAMKRKNRGDTRNMNHIITLFIRLATSLDGGSKAFHERDQLTKILRDESPPGFCSASSKFKKINKLSERKYTMRSNGSSFINGAPDNGDYASDGEIKRHLSKLNKRSIDSGSETSDGSSEETETDSTTSSSESELGFESEGRRRESSRDDFSNTEDGFETFADDREWGARMTKASLVPPVTRKYEVIDHYVIVADQEEVERKMQVSLPDEYKEKLDAQKNGTEESDMEIPEVKDYKPRKQLGDEVLEQEVYGIDPYTHNLLLDSMPDESDWPLSDKHVFIEDMLLRTLNRQARSFTGTENTPMKYSLEPVIEDILKSSKEEHDIRTVRVCQYMLNSIKKRPEDNYVAYRKGLGVVCNKQGGFVQDDFVVEFLGEVYPAWKWFEKQDGIRSLQRNSKEPAPEFYNIYLERPKGDADGYDLVVVDAMHKANYASRICHSCSPNCEAKVTAVDGQYQIGIYTLRPIGYGEEVTFDYNSVTESREEYEASVCLCGSHVCRGSYLNLTGEGAFQKVLKECHGILDRHQLMLEACELNSVSEDDYIDLGKAGLGSCLLGGLPDWLIAYSARLVRFINSERVKLPEEILRHNLDEKKKYFTDYILEVEKTDAEVQAEGVYNQRLQNLALTLDKVRYVMRCVFGDPKKAPPPLERLSPEEAVSYVWKGEGSLVDELLHCMAPYMEDSTLNDLRSSIRSHDPSGSDDIQRALRKSLLWLRDEVRNLQCSYKCRHDAAADLIHLYAYTKCFFKIREYKSVTSPPVYITPLDLGPKYSDKLGSDRHEYCKTYGENYCLGQLLFWHNQDAEPDFTLAKASRGCLSLPDISSFYAKVNKPSRQRVYGPTTLKLMLARMEKQSQRPWPKEEIWSFEKPIKVVGSPMLDAVLHNAPLDKELVHWLKHRLPIFHAKWDR